MSTTLPSDPTKTHMDEGTDDAVQARGELAALVDAVVAILDALGAAAQLDIGDGLTVVASGAGVPDVLKVSGNLVSTDGGAGTGPVLNLLRLSPTPVGGDNIGATQLAGHNDNTPPDIINYAKFGGNILDPTTGSEGGRAVIETAQAGTQAPRMFWGAGFYTPNATGGDPGADSGNVKGLQIDGGAVYSHAPYVSAETAVAVDTVQPFTHGLGGLPKRLEVWLRNKTTEYGYAVGEEYRVGGFTPGTGDGGIGIVQNTTQIKIVTGDEIRIMRADTNDVGLLTPANWKWVVRAEA